MATIEYRDAATGLRITDEPHANGARARAVYRGSERIYHCEPVGVGYSLKGYAAAKAEPVDVLLEGLRVEAQGAGSATRHVYRGSAWLCSGRSGQIEDYLSGYQAALICATEAGRGEGRS